MHLHRLFAEHPETAHVAERVCDGPDWERRDEFLSHNGLHNWTDKVAHHAFLHDREYNATTLAASTSSMGDLLRWILHYPFS